MMHKQPRNHNPDNRSSLTADDGWTVAKRLTVAKNPVRRLTLVFSSLCLFKRFE
ncbi:pyridoxine 5'-phosphate synthase PdxJ [Rhodopirellula rubra]|uniref:Pyridoxine 5'-phosphate synthase PdxJ n=1 Tax=Aporhodopirellula rubra TaxID=980271 RepID=A0A7W5H838_9BACT|nr:pyridoxine 5'-phosphate synthase PdxJ [Aporhodopirellula rubra]